MKKTINLNLKIGFIGLGLMGNPMAKNILKLPRPYGRGVFKYASSELKSAEAPIYRGEGGLKAGFNLSVYNRTKEKTREFEKLGAKVYESPQELASQVDILITMVTGPDDVRKVLLGKNGAVKGAKKGLIMIDMSTIGPASAKQIASDLKKYGIEFIDAPVTGSVPKAITGELTIFVGGDKDVFKKVRPVLYTMGKDIKYIGGTGSGQAIKLINNLIIASSVIAVAQGLILAQSMNLSAKKVQEALSGVPAMSPFMKMKIENMVNGDFNPIFTLANMHKDLRLAVNEGTKNKKSVQFLKFVENLYKKGVKSGLSREDMSSVIKVM